MTKSRDIIVFSDEWNKFPTSSIHLFKRLAAEHRVFWISLISRTPNVSVADFKKTVQTIYSWTTAISQNSKRESDREHKQLEPVVSSAILVPIFTKPIRLLNRYLIQKQVNSLKRKFALTNPVLFTTWPTVGDYFEKCPDSSRIYYCVDDWLHYPNHNFNLWQSMEKKTIDNIDGFIGSSQILMNKAPQGIKSLYLPHGVDYQHFNLEAGFELPERARSIRKPVVGFFGLISEWVDLNLLDFLAGCFPDVSFVLIGRAEVDISKLLKRKNVHHVDQVPYSDLPKFASCFDIGIIPFVKNSLTEAVNPLKLLEYFAMGLPVLATRLATLEKVDGPIQLANSMDEFKERLQRLLDAKLDSTRAQAKDIALRNSWDVRAKELSTFINSL